VGDEGCCWTCERWADRESEAVARNPLEGPPARFRVVVHDRAGRVVADHVPTGDVVSIGRVAGNEVQLPSGAISKRQARLTFEGDGVYIEDARSTCGTFVDGRKITAKTRLGDGAKIDVADYRIEVVPA
jgi:pSer/pThr/pTyr-binding forkhead associated (FHA) protein